MLPENWLSKNLTELAQCSPIQEIEYAPLNSRGIRFLIRRDDVLNPYISGNKLYKLFGYLRHYQTLGSSLPLASFGGKFSNHVVALAAAGHSLGIPTKAVIRGNEEVDLSATLKDAQNFGMELHFVDRQKYKLRYLSNFQEVFQQDLGECYWIPEGGAGPLGVEGAVTLGKAIATYCQENLVGQKVCVVHACGTGSSLAGVVSGVAEMGLVKSGVAKSGAQNVKVLGVNVLKGYSALKQEILEQIPIDYRQSIEWDVIGDFHCGGYAKFPDYLASFLTSFESETGVPLDPVYTCKVVWAITQLAASGDLSGVDTLLMVHSGGLQGRRGYGLPFPDVSFPLQ